MATNPTTARTADSGLRSFLNRVRQRLDQTGVFGPIMIREDASEAGSSSPRLVCAARTSAAPASYRLEVDGGRLWVSLVTADRWLSQSIEQDLVHTGDKLEDLIEEELTDLADSFPAADHAGSGRLRLAAPEHFRSSDLLFTFRSPVPVDLSRLETQGAVEAAALWILAYEAAFRNLGDMDAGDEE